MMTKFKLALDDSDENADWIQDLDRRRKRGELKPNPEPTPADKSQEIPEGTSDGQVQAPQDGAAVAPSESHEAGLKQNFLLAYPDESKSWRFVAQEHFRGKSAHLDLRLESGDYLVGWTIANQQPDAIAEPVESLAQAKAAVADADNWKMDMATGEILPREIRGGTVRKGDLRAFPKGVEIPESWLDVEGVTDKPDPGEDIPAGATRNFPGVFAIVDKGTVEHGAKKAWMQEYWIHGKKWGTQRWVFRMLERGKEADHALQAKGWQEEAEEVDESSKYDPGQPRNEAGQFAGGFGATEPPHWASNEGQIVEGYTVFKGKFAAKNDYAVVTDSGQPGPFRKTPEEAVTAHEQVLDKTQEFARAHAEYKGALAKVKDGDMSQWHPLMGGERVTTSHAKLVLRDLGVSTKVRDKIVYGTPVVYESRFGTVYYNTEVMGERYQRLALGQGKSLKRVDTLPPGVIERQPRSDVYWVLLQPDDATPYVLSKEAVDKDWIPPRGISALPKAMREAVPAELHYWEVSGTEALDRRAKLAEMDVRELAGTSVKWSPDQPRDEQGRFGSGGGAETGGGIGGEESRSWGQRIGNSIPDLSAEEDEEYTSRQGEQVVESLKDDFGDVTEEGDEIDYSFASDAVTDWAMASDSRESLVMQAAASHALKVPNSEYMESRLKQVGGNPSAVFEGEEQLSKMIYSDTQKYLTGRGIKPDDTITLYRGVAGTVPFQSGEIVGNPLESWTTSRDIAAFYVDRNSGGKGGFVLTADFAGKEIFALPQTGMGLPSAKEVIVLGSRPRQALAESIG
jgi:hypothetical protein